MSTVEQILPPEDQMEMFGGAKEFTEHGQKWLRYFKESCGLSPDEQVLDVGCGVGRVAIALAGYLSAEGTYEGLDIVPQRIEWCKQNITPRWPNFHFRLADVFNKSSNPGGQVPAKDYSFPYPDGEFDFVFLISVFTHMMPDDLANYLTEIARVLRRGGRCLATYVLLTDESLELLNEGEMPAPGPAHRWRRRKRLLAHDFGHYNLVSTEVPERLVAYRERFLLGLYEQVGLDISNIDYGRWTRRKTPDPDTMLQDAVLAYRPG
jgi:SAM-dependent methyltransferase